MYFAFVAKSLHAVSVRTHWILRTCREGWEGWAGECAEQTITQHHNLITDRTRQTETSTERLGRVRETGGRERLGERETGGKRDGWDRERHGEREGEKDGREAGRKRDGETETGEKERQGERERRGEDSRLWELWVVSPVYKGNGGVLGGAATGEQWRAINKGRYSRCVRLVVVFILALSAPAWLRNWSIYVDTISFLDGAGARREEGRKDRVPWGVLRARDGNGATTRSHVTAGKRKSCFKRKNWC